MRNEYKFDKFSIDTDKKIIYKDGNEISVTNGYEVLLKLVEAKVNKNSSDIVSSEDLLYILDPSLDETNKSSVKDRLYHVIKNIRRELSRDVIIQSTPGYKLGYDVNILLAEPIEETKISAGTQKIFHKLLFSRWTILASVIVLLVLLFIFFPRGIDDDFTKITITKALVHLDLSTEDWHDLMNEEEIQSNEIKSTAIFTKEYSVIKNFPVDTFLDLVGSTTKKPSYEGTHSVKKSISTTDISKQCSATNLHSILVYYNISDEILKTSFPLRIITKYYNAHNHQTGEYHQYTMIHPVEHFDFKISFPKQNQKKYPQIRFLEAANCNSEFVTPGKPLKLFSYPPTDEEIKDLYQYAVLNKDDFTVVWHIENPMVSRIYKIQWNWRYDEN